MSSSPATTSVGALMRASCSTVMARLCRDHLLELCEHDRPVARTRLGSLLVGRSEHREVVGCPRSSTRNRPLPRGRCPRGVEVGAHGHELAHQVGAGHRDEQPDDATVAPTHEMPPGRRPPPPGIRSCRSPWTS